LQNLAEIRIGQWPHTEIFPSKDVASEKKMQQWLTNAIENAEIHKTSPGDYGYPLKGTFLRKSL
jgi:hypothetical protein